MFGRDYEVLVVVEKKLLEVFLIFEYFFSVRYDIWLVFIIVFV